MQFVISLVSTVLALLIVVVSRGNLWALVGALVLVIVAGQLTQYPHRPRRLRALARYARDRALHAVQGSDRGHGSGCCGGRRRRRRRGSSSSSSPALQQPPSFAAAYMSGAPIEEEWRTYTVQMQPNQRLSEKRIQRLQYLLSQVRPSNGADALGAGGTGEIRCLLIGVDYLQTDNQLEGCNNDIDNMLGWIRSRPDLFPPQRTQVHVLTELDSRNLPVRSNMLREFVWVAQAAEFAFVHYAGHGMFEPDASGDEPDRRDECLVPLDFRTAGLISDDELRRVLVDPVVARGAAGPRLIVLLDCCHSATALDLHRSYRPNLMTGHLEDVTAGSVAARFDYDERARIVLVAACRDDESSGDVVQGNTAFGALSHAFIGVLSRVQNPTLVQLACGIQREYDAERLPQHVQLSTAARVPETTALFL